MNISPIKPDGMYNSKAQVFQGNLIFSQSWWNGVIRLENVTVVLNGDTWKEWRKQQLLKNNDDLDVNWTFWDLKVECIDLKLSLWKLLDGIIYSYLGRGVLESAKLKVNMD